MSDGGRAAKHQRDYIVKRKCSAFQDAGSNTKKFLVCLHIFSVKLCLTVVNETHPLVQHIHGGVTNALSGSELLLEVDGEQRTLSQIWDAHQAIPSYLLLAYEALRLVMHCKSFLFV
jgi:hypothetical protein